MRNVLKNPILRVLQDINISKILIQSNFIKVGFAPFQILLHLVYMLVMNKRQSAFVKQSANAYGKDTYYRFVKDSRFNWCKLLMLSSMSVKKWGQATLNPTLCLKCFTCKGFFCREWGLRFWFLGLESAKESFV